MEGQTDIFADPPIARRDDPHTSHIAAARHSNSKRATRQLQILDLVNRFPCKTSGELARVFHRENPGLPIVVAADTPHKRLSDLRKKGWINIFNDRKCDDSGYECHTYVITQIGFAQLEEKDGHRT